MNEEINLGGTTYIISRRAAEISGYAQDYIGQLARSGAIDARRVSGMWYVNLDSIESHRGTAKDSRVLPTRRPAPVAAVTFEGRDYISASRAAKLSGYSPDYVSSLARKGRVPSRNIGSRWYIDREQLLKHKEINDRLLAGVQTISVGLSHDLTTVNSHEKGLHYRYVPESGSGAAIPILPEQSRKQSSVSTEIPIRVVRTVDDVRPVSVPRERSRKTIFIGTFVALCCIVGVLPVILSVSKPIATNVAIISNTHKFLPSFLVREIEFRRDFNF